MAAAVAGGWTLVGRAEELAFVERAVEEKQALLLTGAAGVGKSRFAAEVLDLAAADGWAVVRLAAGIESAAVPFSPFLPLLGEAVGGDTLDRFLTATLALEQQGPRVVVSVDDAHLLDDVSIAFVRHLLVATDVRLVLTARSGVPMPGALADMWSSGLVERIELQPLSATDVEALATSALGGPVAPTLSRWLWSTSDGNPLYVRELLLDAMEREALAQHHGRWVLTDTDRGPGARLRELVAARIGTVEEDDRVALELLAIGQPLGVAVLESIAGPEVVDRLERRALVATTRSRRRAEVRLAHPLHGEVLREELGVRAADERRRQLIAAIAATGAVRAGDDLRLALWRCDVGDTEDWEALLAAARDLTAAFDRPLAAFWTGAKDALPVPITGQSHLETARRLAAAAFESGRSVHAASDLFGILWALGRHDEAAAIDRDIDSLIASDADRYRVLKMRVDRTFFHGGDIDEHVVALASFEDEVADDALRMSARSARAQLLAFAGRDLELALALANEVAAHPATPRRDRIVGATSVVATLSELGRGARALAILDELLTTVTPEDDSITLGLLITIRVVVLAQLKRFDEAHQLASTGHQLSIGAANDAGVGIFSATLASIELQRGHPRAAVDWATAACRHLGGSDLIGARRSALITLANAHAVLGDLPAATSALATLDATPRGQTFTDEEEVKARAWVDVAAGRTSAALARLQAGAERPLLSGRKLRELMLLHDLVRLGHAHVVVDRLRELAPEVDSDLAGAILAQAEGICTGDAGALERAADEFAGASATLWAAEAWAQASVVHADAGRRSSAAAAAVRSAELLAECEGATTPALSLGGPVATLSAREREIAGLAARGLTDKDIAAELYLSARTVQSHLYNVYGKLGIEGRADLGRVLPD